MRRRNVPIRRTAAVTANEVKATANEVKATDNEVKAIDKVRAVPRDGAKAAVREAEDEDLVVRRRTRL